MSTTFRDDGRVTSCCQTSKAGSPVARRMIDVTHTAPAKAAISAAIDSAARLTARRFGLMEPRSRRVAPPGPRLGASGSRRSRLMGPGAIGSGLTLEVLLI